MAKTLNGIVVSDKMMNTVVVEVTTRKPHPMYRKLLKRSKRFKADTNGQTVKVGEQVQIEETKPMSKDKYFVVKSTMQKETGKK
jgi:small subunit ribosomal protein S17